MSTADVDKETRPLLQDSSTTSEQSGISRQLNNASQSTKTEVSLHAVVSKVTIELLSKEITKKWREIGRKLEFSDADLDRIKSDTTEGHKEQVYQMLKKWKEQKGKNATYKRLGEALMKCDRTDLQQWLEREAEALNKGSTVPTNQSDCTNEAGEEEIQFIDMQKKKTLNYIILVSCIILLMFALILTVFFVRRASTTANINPAIKTTTPSTTSMTSTTADRNPATTNTTSSTTSMGTTTIKYPYYVKIQNYADEPGRHNLILGSNSPGDFVLYTSSHKVHGTLFVVTQYTFQYSKRPTETISGVLVRDKWDDDTGGYPELMAGGPGKGYVVVKISSQTHRGFDFSFSVYGRNT
ncbi:uncharacterized protein [Apostichopus japonicus]|uniref:uncharacterized protein n=1 Tax=Stichopus japonicus TaxID=307972 RepID=UPI003AB70B3B